MRQDSERETSARDNGKWALAVVGVAAVLLAGAAIAFWFASGDGDSQEGVIASSPTALPAALAVASTATSTPAAASEPSATPRPQSTVTAATQAPPQTPPSATPAPPSPTQTLQPTVAPQQTSTPTNCTIKITASAAILNFEADKSILPLKLTTEGCEWNLEYTLTPDKSWIAPVPPGGTIPSNSSVDLTVVILRDQLSPGENSGEIVMQSIVGKLTIQVLAERE